MSIAFQIFKLEIKFLLLSELTLTFSYIRERGEVGYRHRDVKLFMVLNSTKLLF